VGISRALAPGPRALLWSAAAALASVGATVLGLPNAGAGEATQRPLATCFWEGPISMKRETTRGFDGRYFNFPEESATYWLSRFNLPEGSRLLLRGRYPHGRYMSLNSYSDAVPTDALSDVRIEPEPGSVNPFEAGNRRDLPRRSWEVSVLDRDPPADDAREPNTLYARPTAAGASIEVAYRVYEPDRGRDLTGGTGLPRHVLELEDGTVLRGLAACEEINDPNREITVDTTPETQWETGRSAPGCNPKTNPAYDPPRWERFFTYEYAALGVVADCTEAGREARHADTPEPEGGNYSNRDSAYIYSHLNQDFGPVLVVEGRLPRTPETSTGQRVMGRGQMRYWSLCTGESRVTTFTPDCLADRQVPVDEQRDYVIAISKREDRPANARRRCGIGWLNWGRRGDGAGDPDYGFLIMRNMLVSPRFEHSIQRVSEAGTEPEVMGPYYPRTTYATVEEFEGRGCADVGRASR
jgi:hypothetical protein